MGARSRLARPEPAPGEPEPDRDCRVPVGSPRAVDPPRRRVHHQYVVAEQRRARSVLVVDDDVDVRESLTDAVEASGRLTFAARDGSEALRLLAQEQVPRPCLVLLDWHMSPMGGADFVAALEARGEAAEFRVVMMSASTARLPETFHPSVLALRKPFEIEELLHILDRFA